MADAVSTQIIQNGYRNIVVNFNNLSDGTGEAAVVKIDPTATGPYGVSKAGQNFFPGIHLTVWEIDYDVKGMGLQILWDADTDQSMVILGGFGRMRYRPFGGLTVPSIAGATGKILFTTKGAMPNSSYNVVMTLKKNVPVS